MGETIREYSDSLTFECPACEHTMLAEIIRGAVVTCPIMEITEGDGPIWNTDYLKVHDCWTDRYQCDNCGYTLKDPETHDAITEVEDLIEWLKAYDRGEVPKI